MYRNPHTSALGRIGAFALVGVVLASLFATGIMASGSVEATPSSTSSSTDYVHYVITEVSGNGSSGTSPTISGQNAPRDEEYIAEELIVKFKPEVGGGVTDVKVDFRTYITHTPILIRNNSEFVAEHGVTGGSGTASDPYIIENWIISASSANGIRIQNTTAYFIIRNCLVENGGLFYSGIRLDNVINGRIENNTCENNSSGIYLYSSSNNILTNNSSDGIYLSYSSYNNLTGNTCENGGGIWLVVSSNNILTNNTCENNYYGIVLSYSSYNNLTGNTCSNNSSSGIYLINSSYNNLTGNTCENNSSGGISLYASYNNLTGNTCENSGTGILLLGSSNILTGNVISNNRYDIYNTGTANTYSSNQFNNNIFSRMLTFTENTRTENVGNNVSFSVSAFNLDGTNLSSGTTVTTSPSESSLSYSGSSTVTGSFTPTRSGTYSLNFTVTDGNSNTTKRRMLFFVGNTASTTTKYYFRGIDPTHGQPAGEGDAKSLLLTAPTSTETWSCSIWIQNSPDEIPNYPLANLSAINTYTWYRLSAAQAPYAQGTIGAERYVTYGADIDSGQLVVGAADVYTWINKNFAGLNWAMDYPQNWYWLSLKLLGYQPFWTTFPSGHSASEASYADFIYFYTTTPAIKSISNPSIVVLSATEPADDPDNATIVLDGTGSTNIVLDNYRRQFIGYTTTINSDGTATIAANGLTGTTTVNSVALDITPSSGSIDVSIDNWNTSGTYYKKWTETGSSPDITASHTIGNLKENTYYAVEVDGTRFNTYQSDSSGQITFTYNGGYSTKTFEIEEALIIDNTPPPAPNLISPPNGVFIGDNTPTFKWTAVEDPSGVTYTLQYSRGNDFQNINGDLDHDGDVDEDDFQMFLAAFGYSIGDPAYNPEADYDDDGTVTIVDYQIWLGYYRNFIGTVTVIEGITPNGDLDNDGDVDEDDYQIFRAAFGHSVGDPAYNPEADYDGTGCVGLVDYQIWLGYYRDFMENKISYTVPDDEALAAGRYYWRVRAVDGASNVGDWSNVWRFRVIKLVPIHAENAIEIENAIPWPLSPTLVSPPNGVFTSDNTPTFRWSSVPGRPRITYTLQYSADNTFQTATTIENITENTYTVPDDEALAPGEYYWRVRAVFGRLFSDWSETWRFIIALSTIVHTTTADFKSGTLENLSVGGDKVRLSTSLPSLVWSRTYDNSVYDTPEDITVDRSNNVYVTGDIGPSVMRWESDWLTVKYDEDGNILWARVENFDTVDYAKGIAADSSGNVYVTGWSGTSFSGTSAGCVTVKYDGGGNIAWIRTYDNNASDEGFGVAVDSSGYVYVTGKSVLYGGGNSLLIIKYDENGEEMWARNYDLGYDNIFYDVDIAVDSSGNAYVAGRLFNDFWNYDFIGKYDENGEEMWSHIYDGGTCPSHKVGIAVDSNDNVYVVITVEHATSQIGCRMTKYDSDGNLLWQGGYGTGNTDAAGVAVDSSDDVYVTGITLDEHYQNPKHFTIKCDPDGGLIWEKIYENIKKAAGIAIDSNDSLYVTGSTNFGSTWDYCTIKYQQHYSPSGFLTSADLISSSKYIIGATATWNADVPEGTSLEVEVSNDGGSTWYLVENGETIDFPELGHVLRYRLKLSTTDDTKTPVLYDITLYTIIK